MQEEWLRSFKSLRPPVSDGTICLGEELTLVLGAQSLHGLSEVVWDFIGMKMHFQQLGGTP